MEIDKDLYKEIKAYCDLNGLKARDFIHKLLKDAFIKEKYGDRPFACVEPKAKKEPVEETTQIPEVISVPFVQFADKPEEDTIGAYEYTSASTAAYSEEELVEEIKVEQPAAKPRKRKLS